MKTLDKEVQIAIINEAGSTYRNYMLAAMKDNVTRDVAAASAVTVAQSFIDLCNNNLVGGVKVRNLSSISATSLSVKDNESKHTIAGKQSATVSLYKWAPTQPEIPDSCVFCWESAEVMCGSNMRGWSVVVPNLKISGETLFELKSVVSADGDVKFSVVPFKDYKIQSIAYNGK